MRRAFTLIELLVVIAIIGVLIGAAGAGRSVGPAGGAAGAMPEQPETDRDCPHELPHAAERLPMSAVAGTGHGVNQSCFALILPELDQRPLYNAYNFNVENYDLANSTVVATPISTLLCPETPLPTDPIRLGDLIQRADGDDLSGGLDVRPHALRRELGRSPRTRWGPISRRPRRAYRGVMMTVQADHVPRALPPIFAPRIFATASPTRSWWAKNATARAGTSAATRAASSMSAPSPTSLPTTRSCAWSSPARSTPARPTSSSATARCTLFARRWTRTPGTR